MASPFDDWTLDDIEEEIEEELARESLRFTSGLVGQDALSMQRTAQLANAIDVNRAFVYGNHWQGGEGWIGPQPQPGESGYDQTMSAIEKGFTSRNAIAEVVNRHAAGVMGREPDWGFAPRRPMEVVDKPTTAEQILIKEAEALLTEWWDKRMVHALLQQACARPIWAGRSAVRIYIPAGLLSNGTTTGGKRTKLATAKDLASALDLIHVAIPMYNEACIITDDETQAQCGVVRYWYESEDENQQINVAELTYLDGDQTIIRTLSEDDAESQLYSLPLGKRLALFEMRRDLLITQQVQQMQRALNLAVSMLPRNVVTGGFLERVLLNAQMPGHWETSTDPKKPDKFVPDDYVTGAGTTNWIQGTQVTDPESGRTTLAAPSIQWRQPVDPKSAIDAAQAHYADILHECDQMHVLTVADGQVGWQSREQARADFESSLRVTQAQAEACGRWLLETPLALAEAITNQPGKYTKLLRASFLCRTDTGPVDANERAQNDKSYASGTMAQTTAMQRNGIPDPDAEVTRINAQPGGDLAILEKRSAIYATLASVGDAYGAAIIAGFSPQQAEALAGPLANQTQDGTTPGAENVQPPGDGTPSGDGTQPSSGDGTQPSSGNGTQPASAGAGKAAPGTVPVKQPIRLKSDRIARQTV